MPRMGAFRKGEGADRSSCYSHSTLLCSASRPLGLVCSASRLVPCTQHYFNRQDQAVRCPNAYRSRGQGALPSLPA